MPLTIPFRTRSVAAVSTHEDLLARSSGRIAPRIRSGGTGIGVEADPLHQRGAAWAFLVLNSAVPMLLGFAVYTLWRSTRLLMFRAYQQTGLYPYLLTLRAHVAGVKPSIPSPILYSVPDAMWVYACTAALGYLWRNHPSRLTRWSWSLLPVAVAVGSEFGQQLKLVPGTFDSMDVSCYVAAFAAAMVSLHFFSARQPRSNQAPRDKQS
jgi:hypothetical protein